MHRLTCRHVMASIHCTKETDKALPNLYMQLYLQEDPTEAQHFVKVLLLLLLLLLH